VSSANTEMPSIWHGRLGDDSSHTTCTTANHSTVDSIQGHDLDLESQSPTGGRATPYTYVQSNLLQNCVAAADLLLTVQAPSSYIQYIFSDPVHLLVARLFISSICLEVNVRSGLHM
jgi:hypothetical protein